MAKSILQWDERVCFKCGRNGIYDAIDEHIVFDGHEKQSDEFGLKVFLCHNDCHLFGRESVHKDKAFDFELKRYAQRKAMIKHNLSEKEFADIFGKSYI